MKKIYLTLIFAIASQFLFSQVYKGKSAENLIYGSDILRFKEFSEIPAYIHFKNGYNIDVEKSLEVINEFIKNDNAKLELKNIQKNKGDNLTYRYIQTIDGFPLEFSAWNIHFNGSRVYAANGEILDNPVVSNNFSISEEQALEYALNHINAQVYMWQNENEEQLLKTFKKDNNATYYPKTEKVIVPDKILFEKSDLKAAYKFDIFSLQPYGRKAVYVDAGTGDILFDLPLIHISSATGTAHTQYSGTQQITTEYHGSYYTLEDYTRGNGIVTLNANNGIDYYSATDFTDNDNIWNNVNAQLDEYATDAHFATTKTYDYYLNIHNRNSLDNNGHELLSFIHFNLIEYGYSSNVNAFWNGYWMTYGDGDIYNGITPLTTIDICGHEVTHGLTQHTADLVYAYESGALNEAFSDIFGAAIEFYAVPGFADWTIGEDIGYVMRSLQNPKAYGDPNTYKGDYWNFGDSDNGGVHTNSGPMNYWFYLLCQGGSGVNDLGNSYNVSAIQINKAEQIAFKLLTEYLTPNSNYSDAYFYGLQAAADIYGNCSPEVEAVGNAFYAIGVILEPYVNEAFASFEVAGLRESCTVPFTVEFLNTSYNSENYLWEFGDGTTSNEINPTHIYTESGFYNVKLTTSSSGCGSDFELKEDYIIISEELECATLMPYNSQTLIESCSGTIYDTGGPDGNYLENSTSVLTIHSPGASSIVLNILEFDIEAGGANSCDYDYIAFYNGNSTNSTLINSTYYCNTTGNPGTISSTGEYITIEFFSDSYVNHSGFKIQYSCVGNQIPPTIFFTADKTYSCDGLISFTDNSYNNPESWEWNFGDGNTSTEQNPDHQYAANGVYPVRLSATNSFGTRALLMSEYITVNMPEAPEIGNILACNNRNFGINVEFEGEAQWYSDINDPLPVYSGNSWVHAPISNNTVYYVRETFNEAEYNVGPVNNTNNGSYFGNLNSIHYLVFDVYSDFVLESVLVNAQGNGNRIISIKNNINEIIDQKTIYIPNGVSRITLNFEIPEGTNYKLVGEGEPYLFRSDNTANLNYPYNIENIVSIKYSSAIGYETSYYYYFYDWKIKTIACKSEFTTVELNPVVCEDVYIEDINPDTGDISVFPNPGNGIFKIYGLENIITNNITITDISGRIITEYKNFSGNIIDLTNVPEGLYFVNIYNPEIHKTIKITNLKL